MTSHANIALPNKNSPQVFLTISTPEEHHQQTLVNSSEWRGALSLEAYLRRETHLLNQDLTRDQGLLSWVLVHQPDGDNTPRQVLCSCETIRKRAMVRDPIGEVREVVCYGVASVFCAAESRGRGYAGRMIEELGTRLQTLEDPQGRTPLFSVLFSDIGKEFYAARGWRAFASSHVAIAPSPPTGTTEVVPEKVELLTSARVAELCHADHQAILSTQLKASSEGKTSIVALCPDEATLNWHFARENFVSSELVGKQPTVRGAFIAVRPGLSVFCFWIRTWTTENSDSEPNTLHILRLGILDEHGDYNDYNIPADERRVAEVESREVVHAIAMLFRAAQQQAREWQMREIMLWNPSTTTLAAARLADPTARLVDREKESITSLRWYGPGDPENVQWVCNEKYGWC